MSSSPARRRRLIQARTFGQARCEQCGANLGLVFSVRRHLARCDELARQARQRTRSDVE